VVALVTAPVLVLTVICAEAGGAGQSIASAIDKVLKPKHSARRTLAADGWIESRFWDRINRLMGTSHASELHWPKDSSVSI
jgi:hypothetical protein